MGRAFPLLLILSGLALASPAGATLPATPARAATQPDWLRRPSADDISRYYPLAAQRLGLGGKVRVQCRLANDGVLSDCVILSETPVGYGFGEAALNVATRFQMRPGTRDGQPIAGQIIIPIAFSAEEEVPAAPAAPTRRGGVMAPLALLYLWNAMVWAIFS